MKSSLNICWKDCCWSFNVLITWCEEPTYWKRPWCWERLRAGAEEGIGGWDGWMASPMQWLWIWANSRRVEDRGAWQATVHGVAKTRTQLNNWTTTKGGTTRGVCSQGIKAVFRASSGGRGRGGLLTISPAWGVNVWCLWPRAPAKRQRTGKALSPLLVFLSNSTVLLIAIVFKIGPEGRNITVVSFHKAVWHHPEDPCPVSVSALSPRGKAFSENKTLTRHQGGSSS